MECIFCRGNDKQQLGVLGENGGTIGDVVFNYLQD
jgi:hypothetical protein